jgi:adenylate kinase
MRVVFLGPPGAGKGTQAERLCRDTHWAHVSTGDLLRDAVARKTPLGRKAAEFMNKGSLVPDDLVVSLVAERLKKDDARSGFVLDGFPRTVPQAEALDRMLAAQGTRLDAVVNVDTPDSVCQRRLSGRRLCPQCNAGYHVEWMPPTIEGTCDTCGAKLIQRADDQPESIRERLRVYHEQAAPLIRYYSGRGVLIDVPGDQEVTALAGCICDSLDKAAACPQQRTHAG